MSDRYVVCWESTITGKTGRGILRGTKADIQADCDDLNLLYPARLHWPELAEPEEPKP